MVLGLLFGSIFLQTGFAHALGTAPPVFSHSGGLYAGGLTLSLTAGTAETIRYTLDGSEPTSASPLYTEPLSIQQPTAVRARTFNDVGTDSSEIVSHTLLVGVDHQVPVVCLIVDSVAMFGPDGMYETVEEDIELVANSEFFETDGTTGWNQLVEIELQGTATSSLIYAQKSIAMKAKGSLGNSRFEYSVFPDQPYDHYRSLTLRNAGNDHATAFLRDQLAVRVLTSPVGVSVPIEPARVHTQAGRIVVAYINGQYWGMYHLRERSDKRYIRVHFDLDDDEIDFIENFDEVREGTLDDWNDLQQYLADPSLADADRFAELVQRVAVDEYLDLTVFQVYLDNSDWPGNNNRRFRPLAGGPWRWLAYDLDYTFGLLTSQGWNQGYAGENALQRLLQPSVDTFPNPEWSTRLFQRLIENDGWRHRWLNRLSDQLNVRFTADRIAVLAEAELQAQSSEFDAQLLRWENLWSQSASVDGIKAFAANRPVFVRAHVTEAFDDVSGTATLAVGSQPAWGGTVHVSTVQPTTAHLPWSGIYFRDTPVPLAAVPAPGYEFVEWLGGVSGSDSLTTVTLTGTTAVTAVFAPVTTATQSPEGNQLLVPMVFPNPVRGVVRWTLPKDAPARVVATLRDAAGRVVRRTEVTAETSSRDYAFPIHALSAGQYILQVDGYAPVGVVVTR